MVSPLNLPRSAMQFAHARLGCATQNASGLLQAVGLKDEFRIVHLLVRESEEQVDIRLWSMKAISVNDIPIP